LEIDDIERPILAVRLLLQSMHGAGDFSFSV
jgi:hypothetical protein